MQFGSMLRTYIWMVTWGGISRGTALLNSLIIARNIGPSEYGVFSIFYSMMILVWQLPQAFDGYFVTAAKRFNADATTRALWKAAIQLKIAFLTIIGLLAYPIALVLSDPLFQKPAAFYPLLASFGCGLGLMFLTSIASAFQEAERFVRFASTHAVYTLAVLAGLFLFYLARVPIALWNVIGLYVVVCTIIGAVSLMIICRRIGNVLSINSLVIRASFQQGKWLFLSLAVSCIFSRVDILFLSRYVDFENLGIYSVAAQLILVVDLAIGAFSGICLPKAGSAVRSEGMFDIYFKQSLLMIAFLLSGIALLIWMAPFLVTLLYGSNYSMSGSILRVLLIGWIFRVIFTPFSFLFIAFDDARTRFLIESWKCIIGISLLYGLVPVYGVHGGAYAMSLTYFVDTATATVVLKYKLGRQYKVAAISQPSGPGSA